MAFSTGRNVTAKTSMAFFSHSSDYCAIVAHCRKKLRMKLRFLPRWNSCRRRTAGYRRGTRIKNQCTNTFRDCWKCTLLYMRCAHSTYMPVIFSNSISIQILRAPPLVIPKKCRSFNLAQFALVADYATGSWSNERIETAEKVKNET